MKKNKLSYGYLNLCSFLHTNEVKFDRLTTIFQNESMDNLLKVISSEIILHSGNLNFVSMHVQAQIGKIE
jgi:hypothetical protein